MDFDLPVSTFIRKYFIASQLSGHEKVTIVCALLTRGVVDTSVDTAMITTTWSRTALKASYNGAYLARAQEHGWLRSISKGNYVVTESGIDHLLATQKLGEHVSVPATQSELQLFDSGQTHTFDRYLRKILSATGSQVRIADSYVDDTIFDNLLDQIPTTSRIQLMYGKSYGSFLQRITRFSTEYPRFAHKNNTNFHDRWMIVDSVAYLLGPSLKDAATKTPASLVRLNSKDSQLLIKFFDKIWKSI